MSRSSYLTCRNEQGDADVLALTVAVFPWGAAFQVVDSLQAANSGCLRAMGRADIGAGVNIVAYYGKWIMIPQYLADSFIFGLYQLHG